METTLQIWHNPPQTTRRQFAILLAATLGLALATYGVRRTCFRQSGVSDVLDRALRRVLSERAESEQRDLLRHWSQVAVSRWGGVNENGPRQERPHRIDYWYFSGLPQRAVNSASPAHQPGRSQARSASESGPAGLFVWIVAFMVRHSMFG